MANRLWHGEFPMDHETWCDLMVSDFPAAISRCSPRLPPHASSSTAIAHRLVYQGRRTGRVDGAAR